MIRRSSIVIVAALSLTGCPAATTAATAASAITSTLNVIRDVRALVCTAKLDPLFGDPRAGEQTYVPAPRDAAVEVVEADR